MTPEQLETSASEFGQADPLLAQWMMVYLLAQIAGNTLTPAQLATKASAYGQFDPLLARWAMLYLLQEVA